MKSVKDYIISIPDFPSKGIIFRDVTSVLESPEGYALAIDELNKLLDGVDYDLIAGTESRGFIFGAPLAYMNKKGFIPVRKKGKLPRETVEMSYDLEYGSATIEIHKDAIKPGDKVVLVDDLIATGGTIQAAAKLVEELGGEVDLHGELVAVGEGDHAELELRGDQQRHDHRGGAERDRQPPVAEGPRQHAAVDA